MFIINNNKKMENTFNLKKFLAEGKMLKEETQNLKVYEGETPKGYFSELIKIENFTNTQDVLNIINKNYLEGFETYTPEELEDEGFYTKSPEGKNYQYAYISGDGEVYFVESLKEFSKDRQTEEDWDIASWKSIN